MIVNSEHVIYSLFLVCVCVCVCVRVYDNVVYKYSRMCNGCIVC